MAGKLELEIRQTKAIRLLEEEASLNIVRTADVLMAKLVDVLKPYGLSATQYNVLRILRGAGASGACCKDVANRMLTRDPDITRLMDRLEKRGLLTRDRAKEDRRFVTTRLTGAGLDVVNELDGPVERLHRKQMKHMAADQLRCLVGLLEEVRSGG
ncbi:MAG TPA: MarR family transcriptional regulator [Candidatus Acidoferrales bacterium]|nr:MarR family transcriptional regulator [Candidatus Acidoferrales bacterium]